MQQKKHNAAFTIVELIIVIAVIAILATVVVVYLGSWRTNVAKTEVNSDIANLKASMDDVRNRTNGYPVFSIGTKFTSTGAAKDVFVQSEYVEITYAAGNATYYCVNFKSLADSSVTMYLNTSGGNTTPQSGTC